MRVTWCCSRWSLESELTSGQSAADHRDRLRAFGDGEAARARGVMETGRARGRPRRPVRSTPSTDREHDVRSVEHLSRGECDPYLVRSGDHALNLGLVVQPSEAGSSDQAVAVGVEHLERGAVIRLDEDGSSRLSARSRANSVRVQALLPRL